MTSSSARQTLCTEAVVRHWQQWTKGRAARSTCYAAYGVQGRVGGKWGGGGTFAQPGTPLMSFSMGDVSPRGPFFTCGPQ